MPRPNGEGGGGGYGVSFVMIWEKIDRIVMESHCLKLQSGISMTSQDLWTPWWQGSWGQHGAHLGPVGPMWAPCRPHEPCNLGMVLALPCSVVFGHGSIYKSPVGLLHCFIDTGIIIRWSYTSEKLGQIWVNKPNNFDDNHKPFQSIFIYVNALNWMHFHASAIC